jgi:chorismate synthase
MSDMAPDDVHDELMCSMDVVAEVHAQDAEREQQREGVTVGCVRPDGYGAGDGNSVVGRGFEGEDDGVTGCEGVDGVEVGASMAARETEGSDEDEVMAGKENVSMQHEERGGGATGGIKKGKRRRGKQKGTGHRQWMAAKGADLRPAAGEASVS